VRHDGPDRLESDGLERRGGAAGRLEQRLFEWRFLERGLIERRFLEQRLIERQLLEQRFLERRRGFLRPRQGFGQ
jgi:hypothetical protein